MVVVVLVVGTVVVVVMVYRIVPFFDKRLAYDDFLKWPIVPPPLPCPWGIMVKKGNMRGAGT